MTVMTAAQYLGESQAAEFLQEQLANCNHFMQKSVTLGIDSVVLEELADVWEECSEPNWDGYNALPATRDTYNNTERFLLALPFGVRPPSVGAEPDGHITLEWHYSRRCTLSVSISPDDKLHYAALLGARSTCGTEPFLGEVPKTILNLIGEVYTCWTH